MRTMVPLLASESLIPGWVVDTAFDATCVLAMVVGAAIMVAGVIKAWGQ